MTQSSFRIDVHNGDIIVWSANPGFIAVYYKPSDQPQLLLRHHTRTDDAEILAAASRVAKDKARELGWIV